MSNNAHDLSNRLLNALDNNYNVVDMHTVNEIISVLERINITKELLETTRLGKHVNELRRKTADPTLARRAKVLVKRWRDLVIPTRASPAHTGSNRSSAERQVRRLGGTPLTSPALSRVVSPAVNSPRPPSRPAWGGYESDSQDVILVDDDPPPPPPPALRPLADTKPVGSPAKRPMSPGPLPDEKKQKRDKKPKKKRGHSRASTGADPPAPLPPTPLPPAPAPAPPPAWAGRNGAPERRRNGCKKGAMDSYAALVNKLPQVGAKKVKTTKELLEQIQSRGAGGGAASPDDDVVVVEDDVPPSPVPPTSPLRNGRAPTPPTVARAATPPPRPPLEDPREYADCTCGEESEPDCPAARRVRVRPATVLALHHALVPGVNGTRAPLHPHRFAVRPAADKDTPGLFASVVPLYKYSDYANDFCVKNMSRVPMLPELPWSRFAPAPPEPPPPPPRAPDPPFIVKEEEEEGEEAPADRPPSPLPQPLAEHDYGRPIGPEMVSLPILEPSERLKGPLLTADDERNIGVPPAPSKPPDIPTKVTPVPKEFKCEPPEHRTVERTKTDIDGRTLYSLCRRAIESVPYTYPQVGVAPVVSLPGLDAVADADADMDADADVEVEGADAAKALWDALDAAKRDTEPDELGRPPRTAGFAEWHECAELGDLIALPYVVID